MNQPIEQANPEKRSSRFTIDRRNMPMLVTLALLIALYVFGLIFYEEFRSPRHLVDLLKGNAAVGVCAVGMTFVILSAGIDLSVGSVLALSSITIATLIGTGVDPLVAFVIALFTATLFGGISGVLINEFDMPPFLVTLAGMFFARGLAFVVNMSPTSIDHPTIDWILDDFGFMFQLPG